MGRLLLHGVRVAPSLVAIVSALVFAPAARSQEIVRQWFGDSANQFFGSPIAWVGDVNADGFMDIGVAAPDDDTVFSSGGMLRVISGQDGTVLYSFYGDAAGAQLGTLGAPLGDVDLDGFDDILVSEPRLGTGSNPLGRIFVYSGKDGSELRRFTGNSSRHLSGSICGTGDVDGDGVPDLAASSAAGNYVTLFSGATSAEIRTLTASDAASTYFGHGLLDPGDVDGDGVNDLIILENSCVNAYEMNYYAFSGATGATIWRKPANTSCFLTYWHISTCLSPVVIGDVDGDGIADWAMGTWGFGRYSGSDGSGSCYSGKDGSLLFGFYPTISFRSGGVTTFGQAIAAAGDVNGDGVPDVAGSDWLDCDDLGGDVFFFSGVDGSMLFHVGGGPSAVSLGSGMAGGLDCDGDGKLDFFAGDTSDTTNGVQAGAVTQFHIEPIVLDAVPRVNPSLQTRVDVNGGIPGNSLVIFLADVNGVTLFDLVEVDSFDSSRRSDTTWSVPSGLTGITARFIAISLDASGRLLKSNYETITFS